MIGKNERAKVLKHFVEVLEGLIGKTEPIEDTKHSVQVLEGEK